jgi:capsular polysaccharide transport system permease protein
MRGSLTQLQVVHALLLRETKTRFGVARLGYLWALIEPALWIGMFAGFYGTFGHMATPGTNIVAFITCGIIPFSLFRDSASRCLVAISANVGLLFYPQVRPLDLVIARAILEIVTFVVVFMMFLAGVGLWEGQLNVESWLEMLGGVVLAGGLGSSFGLLCCSLNVFNDNVERLLPSLLRPLIWFSAVFHPVDSVPNGFRDVLLYNPLVHATEMVRDGCFPGYGARHIDYWYPIAWILVMLYLGLTLERAARRRLEVA